MAALGLLLFPLAGCGGPKGAAAVPAAAPHPAGAPGAQPWVGRLAIEWQRGERPREVVRIGPGGVELGPAEGPFTRYLFNHRRRAADVTSFSHGFAPFTFHGPAESLVFHGLGTAPASPTEQRMIVSWAHQVLAEAVAGRGGEAYGVVLSWHRSGDAGSTCDELTVDLSGEARAGSCDEGGKVWGRLGEEPLRRLYAWLDAWGPFQAGLEGDGAGLPPTRLLFAGRGRAKPSAAEESAVAELAAELFRELAARRPAPPQPATPSAARNVKGAPAPPPVPSLSPAPETPGEGRLLRPAVARSPQLPTLLGLPAVPPPVPPSAPNDAPEPPGDQGGDVG
ncbi:MAG TPA: hypothetical protein VMM92_13690 [Thermoanaerobaculia bacterium]|nr:hypothetical protein [Thermoanaerobaculia bacterium]